MQILRVFSIIFLSCLLFSYPLKWASGSNTSQITENGKKVTFTLPLIATITTDTILRDEVEIIPLSSLTEVATWDKDAGKFNDHQLLLRVVKTNPVPLLVEIINDHYTCSYNKSGGTTGVNEGYQYSVEWRGHKENMDASTRRARIDADSDWLPSFDKTNYFLPLTLNIVFPDFSKDTTLIAEGGMCRGSVTMLVSNAL